MEADDACAVRPLRTEAAQEMITVGQACQQGMFRGAGGGSFCSQLLPSQQQPDTMTGPAPSFLGLQKVVRLSRPLRRRIKGKQAQDPLTAW